jgi:hypothetical protein
MVKIGIKESGCNLEDFLKNSWMPSFFVPASPNHPIKNGDNTLFQEPFWPSTIFRLPLFFSVTHSLTVDALVLNPVASSFGRAFPAVRCSPRIGHSSLAAGCRFHPGRWGIINLEGF